MITSDLIHQVPSEDGDGQIDIVCQAEHVCDFHIQHRVAVGHQLVYTGIGLGLHFFQSDPRIKGASRVGGGINASVWVLSLIHI